ncbi:MAG TPA: hypothetical protein VKA57_10325 [Solirubrobacteraceae bacterium]|nr:hypothetical protein [Solirubrobacteraceae bacterium]
MTPNTARAWAAFEAKPETAAEHVREQLDALRRSGMIWQLQVSCLRYRQAVVDTLQALQQNLLAHLDYEELSIDSTVRRMRDEPDRLSYGAREPLRVDRLPRRARVTLASPAPASVASSTHGVRNATLATLARRGLG